MSHQCPLRDLQRAPEGIGFTSARFRWLSGRQHDFKLDEAPKVLDSIQVNPGSSNEKDFTFFCDDAANWQNVAEQASIEMSLNNVTHAVFEA